MPPADEVIAGAARPVPQGDTKVVALVSAGHFFSHFYLLSLPPLFIFIQQEFQVSYVALGLAATAYNLIGGLIQAPVGFLVDRFGARLPLLLGFGVNALAILLMGFVDVYGLLLVLAVLAGIGNSVFHPADYAIMSGAVDEKRVGRAFGIHTFSGFLGGSIAPLTMGMLAAFWNWRVALVVTGAAGLAVLVAVALSSGALAQASPGRRGAARTPPADGAAAQGVKTGWSLLLTPAMLIFFLLFCVITFTTSGVYVFTINALIDLRGTGYAVANAALTGFLFSSALGVLLGGFLADRFGRHDMVATVFLIIAAGAILLPVIFDLPPVALVAAMSLSGLAFGTVQPARDMMVRAITPPGEMGKTFGFLSVGMAVGASLAPLLFGWLMDHGRPDGVFIGAAVFMLLIILTALAGRLVGRRSGLRRS